MRRSQRVHRHLNYDIYHKDGLKVYKEAQTTDLPGSTSGLIDMSVGDQAKTLEAEIFSLTDDIKDFIEENVVEDFQHNVADMDAAIQRMEDFRSAYREKHRKIFSLIEKEEYNKMFQQKPPDGLVATMKDYILRIKENRKSLRNDESAAKSEKSNADSKYFKFLHQDLNVQMCDIAEEIDITLDDLSDYDLVLKKSRGPEMQKKLDMIWQKILELMKMNIDDKATEAIQTKYRYIVGLKSNHVDNLQKEVLLREIKKKESFKRSKLNIKLAKFSGYNSPSDIYTFQSDFEKIHLAETPSDVLPDLLKNNFLEDPAYSLVKSVESMDEIWKRLKQAYGNSKILLQKKLKELGSIDATGNRNKDFSKTELWLSKIITMMKDLMKLASDHKIESMLYNGDGLDRIMKVLGEGRLTRWLAKECNQDDSDTDDNESFDCEKDNERSWHSLIRFLEKELKVLQKKAMIFQNPADKEKGNKEKGSGFHQSDTNHPAAVEETTPETSNSCAICGSKDHVTTNGPRKSKIVQYFACEAFTKMTAAERFKILREKELCYQCLYPGADWNSGKHKEGKCQKEFACKDSSHDRFTRKKHVLVCEDHKAAPENIELFKTYKEKFILKNQDLPVFSKDMSLSFHSHHSSSSDNEEDSDAQLETPEMEPDDAAYVLQVIEIDNKKFLIFFDSGCGKFLVRYKAIQKLGNRATLHIPPPLRIGGVGGIVVKSPYGAYNVKLPLYNGTDASFTGTCLEKLTEEFPQYPLQGAVEEDIRTAYKISGGDVNDLPKLPRFVGGEVDFMIGIKYNRYNPKEIFRTVSGLSIYESQFKNADGGRGLIGGNHQIFTAIEKQFYQQNQPQGLTMFLHSQQQIYSCGYLLNPDVGLLGFSNSREDPSSCADPISCDEPSSCDDQSSCDEIPDKVYTGWKQKPQKALKKIEEFENAGTEITYRCVKCRKCKDCKDCDHNEARSIREEVEEDIIKNSVLVDVVKQKCTAKMPIIEDPVTALAPNKHKVMKVYQQQLKKLSKSAEDRESILKAERKLQDLGFVDWLKNLSSEDQEMLKNSKIQNFIAWRIAWKSSSVTSPCRPVFDASQPTGTGKSLNKILVTGKNNMNKLQERQKH